MRPLHSVIRAIFSIATMGFLTPLDAAPQQTMRQQVPGPGKAKAKPGTPIHAPLRNKIREGRENREKLLGSSWTRDEFKGLRPNQILEALLKDLDSHDRDVRYAAILAISNFAADYPAHCETAVKGLVEKLGSHSSDGPESAAWALSMMSVSVHASLDYIREHVLGRSAYSETTEQIDMSRHFDPSVRRYLACALTSAAIGSRKVSEIILDDLIDCFSLPEEDLHCHIASELFQIAHAHSGAIAERVYEALRAQQAVTGFERVKTEIAQLISGLDARYPKLKVFYPPPGLD